MAPVPAPAPVIATARTVELRAIVAFCLVALIWGSTWLVIKDQVANAGPVAGPSWTITWRFSLAALGMMALAVIRRENLRLPPRSLALAAGIGLVQFCSNFQFVYRAEQHVTSGLVAVIYALLLVPNAVLGRIFLGARMSGRFIAGSVVAMAGIALLMWHEYLAAPQGSVLLGVALTLGGVFSASIANVAQATRAGRAHAVVPLIAWAMVFGALADAVLALCLDGVPVIDTHPRYWAGVGYLALIGSVVAFPLYFSLIRAIGAGRAGYTNAAVPVVAMALSTLFEGYRWSGLAIGGALLAMSGLVLALSQRASQRAIAASPSRNVG